MAIPDPEGSSLVVFGSKKIRRTWHENECFFSVVDIVEVLTDSPNARDYWYRMKQREAESSGFQLSTLCRQLKLTSADGKAYKTDCVSVKSPFRVNARRELEGKTSKPVVTHTNFLSGRKTKPLPHQKHP